MQEDALLLCNEELTSPSSGDNEHADDDPALLATAPASDAPFFLSLTADPASVHGFISREGCHLPDAGYLAKLRAHDVISSARSNAVHWMIKVSNVYSFSPLTVTLAVNYFDRYLSKQLLRSWKAWMIELLSVACLSLAAKMEESEVHLLQELQIEGLDHIFEPKTIQRMEVAVMKLLGWRMSSVTPFAFIECLFQSLDISNTQLKSSLLNRVNELLSKTLSEMDFLVFPPSVVALAVVRCALEELIPRQADIQTRNMLSVLPIAEEQLDRCYMLMQELVVDPLCSLTSLSQVLENRKASPSPFNALELSHTGESYPDLERDSRDWDQSAKAQNACVKSVKRKLDEFLR